MKLTNEIKKWFITAMVVFFGLSCGGSTGGAGSSGGGSTTSPIDIPAPVMHLSISSPDSDGESRVTGAAGFADAGTTVTVSNMGAASDLSSAENQALSLKATTASITATVAADGTFNIEITASISDTLVITYTLAGVLYQTDSNCPEQVPPFDFSTELWDVSVDPTLDTAMVLLTDDADAIVSLVSLSDGSISDTVVLPGASGATRIATNPRTGDYHVLDATEDTVWSINGVTGTANTVSISDIADLEVSTTSSYVVVSHTSGNNAATYYDPTFGTTQTIGISTDTGATHDESSFVDLAWDGATDILAILSRMSDGNYYVTSYTIPDSTTITQITTTRLDTLTTPGGLALFSDGSEALITDYDNNTLLRVHLATDAVTEITVGDSPIGVAIDDTDATAYVVTQLADTVSFIDLSTNEISATTTVGILPTEIAADNAGVIALNTNDITATIF